MGFPLAIGTFIAFSLAWLLSIKNNHGKAGAALSVIFPVNGITILPGFLEIVNRQAGYPFAFILHTSAHPVLLHGPLMWLCVSFLTKPQFKLRPVHLWHLLPFAIMLLIFVIINYTAAQRLAEEQSEAFRQYLMFPAISTLIFASTQGYHWYSWFQLRRQHDALKPYFGNPEHKDPAWLGFLLIGATVFYAIIGLLYLTDFWFDLMPYASLQSVGYAFAAVYTLYLGYFGFRQGDVFTPSKVEIAWDALAGKKQEMAGPAQNEVAELQQLMEREKPHTDPELSLAQLARAAGTTMVRLSNLLNQQMGMNFFEFVKRRCVEEFKQQVLSEQGKKLNLMGIACNSGFNSKPTFNRVFRSYTVKTPSQWLAEQQKQ